MCNLYQIVQFNKLFFNKILEIVVKSIFDKLRNEIHLNGMLLFRDEEETKILLRFLIY